jgi:LAO/AO transport system kinase
VEAGHTDDHDIIADVDAAERKNGIEGLMERLRGGDVRALARAISLVEDEGDGAKDLLVACSAYAGRARKIGVTGAPGAGKSTLVDRMARWLLERGNSVAVIAVDPTSPYTGGALLGDRIRMMQDSVEDPGSGGIYVRSMASRGALGGLSRAVGDVCRVMEAAGRDVILIETVGVGQDEVDVARLADVTVLVLVPGMGDDVQSLKAGVMEIADVFVINKSDGGGAEKTMMEIAAMQGLSDRSKAAPTVKMTATTGEGMAELMEAVAVQGGESRVTMEAASWMRELRLDHLGVAVKSLESARGFYEMLGMRVVHEETVEHEQVKVAMLPMGESRLELLEPVGEDSVIGRFLERRGEGLHHIAMKTPDVDAMFRRLSEGGVRLVSDRVRAGAGGHRYFFVHPASTGGVLVEVVGE